MPQIAELLERAKALHVADQWADAERLYREILAANPENPEVLYLLGAACHSLGKVNEAIRLLEESIRLGPDHPDPRHHLGVLLLQANRLDEAVAHLQEAWRRRPQSAEIAQNLRLALATMHNQRAVAFQQQGRWTDVIAACHEALGVEPNYVPAQGNLGNAWKHLGNLDQAAACYRRVVELAPDTAMAFNDLGTISQEQGRFDEAIGCYRRAIELDGNLAEAYTNLGTVLSLRGKQAEAETCCRQACQLKPELADAHRDLGTILAKQGKFAEAIACCRRALQLEPLDSESHDKLGAVLAEQGSLDEAVACYRRALEIDPNLAEVHYNLADALKAQNKLEPVRTACRRAIELEPRNGDLHYFLGLLSLMKGEFLEAWPEYEWRLKSKGFEDATLDHERWDGSPAQGRTILVRAEQGHGDSMQFVRYASLIQQQGATVILECQPSLARLLARTPGVEQVVAQGQPRPPFDAYVPLLSLPGIFQTSLDNVPAQIPYLFAEPQDVQRWKQELAREKALKIGIAWQGNPGYRGDRFRSIPLTRFAQLADVQGVRLYSLQWGVGREQLKDLGDEASRIVDLGDRLGDFAETAAIVKNLDLVICSDSATAHLAGGLGVPVWVPLPFSPDWRWMLGRDDSPWYPTMRLFRQREHGDWDRVFQQLAAELEKRLKRQEANDG